MNDHPHPHWKTLEAVEACRPYSDDLADPAMSAAAAGLAGSASLRALAERIERLDVRIGDAFHDVPLPAGLAERICQRLAAADAESEPESAPVIDEPVSAEPIASAGEPGPRVSRRWLVMGMAGIVAAAVMFTVAVLHVVRVDPHRPPMLEVAMQFFESDWEQVAGGQPLAQSRPSRGYPLSPLVVRGDWVRWRPVYGFLGRRGVAYDLTRPGGTRATLYVVKYPLVGLPFRPSIEPDLSTHDRCTSAWQSGPVLFVLVVEGGPQTYRSFLNLPSGPLT